MQPRGAIRRLQFVATGQLDYEEKIAECVVETLKCQLGNRVSVTRINTHTALLSQHADKLYDSTHTQKKTQFLFFLCSINLF